MKSRALNGLRAGLSGKPTPGVTFAPNGTGRIHSNSNSPFQWALKGREITITTRSNQNHVLIEFTNRNQLYWLIPAAGPIVFKPAPFSALTNAPAK